MKGICKAETMKLCGVCGEIFHPLHPGSRRCVKCSIMVCQKCRKEFIPKRKEYNHKFCSPKCKYNALKGKEPDSLKLKRGVRPRTSFHNHTNRRNSAFDVEWRNRVFERDNYTCRECGKRGYPIEAHHIKPFKAYPQYRFEINNGITLCKACHRKTKSYGYRKMTRYLEKRRERLNAQACLPL